MRLLLVLVLLAGCNAAVKQSRCENADCVHLCAPCATCARPSDDARRACEICVERCMDVA